MYKFICGDRKQDSKFGVSNKVDERKYILFTKQSLTVIAGAEENRTIIFCDTPVEMPSYINLRQQLACVEILGDSFVGLCNKIQNYVKMYKCKKIHTGMSQMPIEIGVPHPVKSKNYCIQF